MHGIADVKTNMGYCIESVLKTIIYDIRRSNSNIDVDNDDSVPRYT